eukprot:1152493-Pelagomonas_calceolata.AAC.3
MQAMINMRGVFHVGLAMRMTNLQDQCRFSSRKLVDLAMACVAFAFSFLTSGGAQHNQFQTLLNSNSSYLPGAGGPDIIEPCLQLQGGLPQLRGVFTAPATCIYMMRSYLLVVVAGCCALPALAWQTGRATWFDVHENDLTT